MRYSWLFIPPLFAIVCIVALVVYRLLTKKHTPKHKKAVIISHSKKARILPEYEKARVRYRILLVLAALFSVGSIFSCTLTASRPIQVNERGSDADTRDIMLCIDISGSTSNYREEFIGYFNEIVDQLEGERIGITIFAEHSTVLAPLSNDYEGIKKALLDLRNSYYLASSASEIDTNLRYCYYNLVVGGGSNIGSGVVSCLDNIYTLNDDNYSKSMIVLTDNHQSPDLKDISIVVAANYAKAHNVIMYGVNIGNDFDPSEDVQFRAATTSTGGLYFTNKQQALKAAQAIKDQEEIRHKGEIEYVYEDSPNLGIQISFVLIVLLFAVIWRIKL